MLLASCVRLLNSKLYQQVLARGWTFWVHFCLFVWLLWSNLGFRSLVNTLVHVFFFFWLGNNFTCNAYHPLAYIPSLSLPHLTTSNTSDINSRSVIRYAWWIKTYVEMGLARRMKNRTKRQRNMGENLLIRVDESDPLSFSLIRFSVCVFFWVRGFPVTEPSILCPLLVLCSIFDRPIWQQRGLLVSEVWLRFRGNSPK